jgi:Ca2+/Na+ antiporter
MGLWNFPAIALALEVAFLFGGLWLYFRTGVTRRTGMIIFAVLMVAIQAFVFFGPPSVSDRAAAMTALAAYALFAAVIALLERRSDPPALR